MTAPLPAGGPRPNAATTGPSAGLAPTAAAVRAAKRNRRIALVVWGVPVALVLTAVYWRLAVSTLPLNLGFVTWLLPAAIAAMIVAMMWALIVEPNSRGNALGDELRASKTIDAQAVTRDEQLVARGKRVREHGELCAEVSEAELLEAKERIIDALEVSHRALQIAAGVLGLSTVPPARAENLVKPTMPHVDRIRDRIRGELAILRELATQLGVQHLPALEPLPSPHVALSNPADVAPDTEHVDPRGLPSFAGSTLTATPAGPVEPVEEQQPGRRRARRVVLVLLLVTLAAAALAWLLLGHGASSLATTAPPVSSPASALAPAATPPPGTLVPTHPVVPDGLTEGVDYSFDWGRDGQPARWGCDAPITVRLAGPTPAGAKEAVASAVAALRDASGLPLVIGTPLPDAVTHAADVPVGEIVYSSLTPHEIATTHLDLTGDVLGKGGTRVDPATGRVCSRDRLVASRLSGEAAYAEVDRRDCSPCSR